MLRQESNKNKIPRAIKKRQMGQEGGLFFLFLFFLNYFFFSKKAGLLVWKLKTKYYGYSYISSRFNLSITFYMRNPLRVPQYLFLLPRLPLLFALFTLLGSCLFTDIVDLSLFGRKKDFERKG